MPDDDEESEIEDDVRQQMRNGTGEVDMWKANDNNYYSQLLPERRRLGQKEEPLALMPPSYISEMTEPLTTVNQSERKPPSQNVAIPPIPVTSLQPPDSQRDEILEKLNKKKNLFGPVNPSEIALPAWSKKRKQYLKPELD